MTTARDWLDQNIIPGLSRQELELLVEHFCGLSKLDIYLDLDALGLDSVSSLDNALQERKSGKPIQYIIGEVDFLGLRLIVDERALIPRPETEWIVDRVRLIEENVEDAFVVDMGTGSGCIALALQHSFPTWSVVGIEQSTLALSLAVENSKRLESSVRFIQGDLTDFSKGGRTDLDGIDILISNPPYITDIERSDLQREVKDFEPSAALFAGSDPQFYYRHLAQFGRHHLRKGGRVYLECHEDFAHDTAKLFEDHSYVDLMLENDLSNKPRLVRALWNG